MDELHAKLYQARGLRTVSALQKNAFDAYMCLQLPKLQKKCSNLYTKALRLVLEAR